MSEKTAPLDLLEHKADQRAAQQRAEERRLASVQVVNSIYRLVKVLRIHTDSNQATVALIEGMAAAVNDYCEKTNGVAASVLFADDAVFVNGQMLRASKETYAAAEELAQILDRCGASEITVERGVGAAEVGAFARAVIAIMRTRAGGDLVSGNIPRIKLRRIRQSLGSSDRSERAPASERTLQSYAAAVVVLREYLDELRGGKLPLPNRVRRAAQKLVSHVDETPHLLTRIAVTATDERDPAATAVHSGLLAMMMGRRLTSDRVLLAALLASAMLWDVAGMRLDRKRGNGPMTEPERDRLPVSAVVVHTAIGRIQASSIIRTVLAFEALWARRAHRRGPVYKGRVPPTTLAGLLSLARQFHEKLQPPQGGARPRADMVVQSMIQNATDEQERVLMRVLLGALGIVPGGTPVELNTGEAAIVAAPPGNPHDVLRPPVRIVKNASGHDVSPVMIDLASPPPRGQPERRIRRVVPRSG